MFILTLTFTVESFIALKRAVDLGGRLLNQSVHSVFVLYIYSLFNRSVSAFGHDLLDSVVTWILECNSRVY